MPHRNAKNQKPHRTRASAIQEGTLYRTFEIRADQVNADERTVGLSFSSETPVERWWGNEILDHSPGSCRLDRLNNGGAILVDHNPRDQVGVNESASIGGDRRGHATVRFGKSARAEEIFQDVLDGIRKNVSVGYQIHSMILESEDEDTATYRIRDWEPLEISIVSIPADTSVGVGRAAPGDIRDIEIIYPNNSRKEEPTMEKCTKCGADLVNGVCPACSSEARNQPPAQPAQAVQVGADQVRTAEIARIREIQAIGDKFGLEDLAREHISKGLTVEEMRKAVLEKVGNATPLSLPQLDSREEEQFSIRRAIAGLSGLGERAGLEFDISQDIARTIGRKTEGIFIPLNLRAALSTSTSGTEKGGYTVQTTLQPLIEILRNKLMVRQMGATVLSVKGPIAFPRQTGTTTLVWVGEAPGSDTTESEATFEQLILTPKSAQATTAYTKQLLMESSIDIENFVRNDLTLVNAVGIDSAAINGTGNSNQPKGILATDNIGVVAGGTDGLAPAWSHIVGLETKVAVANADTGTLGYLTNTKVRGLLKQTLKAANVPGFIWESGATYGAGFGEMNGYRAGATNQVPSNLTKGGSSGVCSAIVFGDWSALFVVDFGVMEITVDPYSQKKKGIVEVTTLIMADVGARHPESFAAMKDALAG